MATSRITRSQTLALSRKNNTSFPGSIPEAVTEAHASQEADSQDGRIEWSMLKGKGKGRVPAAAEAERDNNDEAGEGQNSNADGEDPALIKRIEDCIGYMRTVPPNTPVIETYFVLPNSPSTALDLLSSAAAFGLATLIYDSPGIEGGLNRYSIGSPPLPPQYPSGVDPLWWAGLDRAAIKAGPNAEPKEIKNVASALKKKDMRRAGREKKARGRKTEEELKLEEGLFRQENGYRMDGEKRVKRQPDSDDDFYENYEPKDFTN